MGRHLYMVLGTSIQAVIWTRHLQKPTLDREDEMVMLGGRVALAGYPTNPPTTTMTMKTLVRM